MGKPIKDLQLNSMEKLFSVITALILLDCANMYDNPSNRVEVVLRLEIARLGAEMSQIQEDNYEKKVRTMLCDFLMYKSPGL